MILLLAFFLLIPVSYYMGSALALFLYFSLSVILLININYQERKQIIELTMYLKRLNLFDFNFELQDFHEGELSLLKSEIHKTMYILKNYNVKLKQQKEFIYDSLSDISHQLKTPVAGLQLILELLEGDDINPEHLMHMQSQVARLQSLIEQLLVHIQLEAQSIQMKAVWVSSKNVVNDLIKMVPTDVNIMVDIEDHKLVLDPNWTSEALFNVLHNKLRYAQSIITIRGYKTKLYYIIEISDDGSEIEVQDRENIFQRFYKGASSDSNSVGIGLAITKEIMEQQGGKILITDRNTFKFIFDDKSVTS